MMNRGANDYWQDNIHYVDYDEHSKRRLSGRDAICLAEAFVYEAPDLCEQKRWIAVAVAAPRHIVDGFDWQRAFGEARKMRNNIAARFRGDGPVGTGDILHFWPDPVD